MVGLALALYGEHVVHQGHLDLLRIHARQGQLDDVGAILDPPSAAGSHDAARSAGSFNGVVEESREEVIEVVWPVIGA